LIDEVVAALPPGAVEVSVSSQQGADVPEHDLDHLRFQLTPRAAGALDIMINVYESYGGVDVFVGSSPPIELTTPINVNNEPPRPFLDVIREVLTEVAAGHVDVGTWPGGEWSFVGYWSEGRREANYGRSKRDRITWSAASPWS
jgi:hypothetical protein